MQETVQNLAAVAEEVAHLREQVLDLGAQVVALTKMLADAGQRHEALEEGLHRVGDATGLPLLPAVPRARRHGHLLSLPGGAR